MCLGLQLCGGLPHAAGVVSPGWLSCCLPVDQPVLLLHTVTPALLVMDCRTTMYCAVLRLPCTEEHRALVRTNLRALLEQGINPLSFFDRDYKKV